MRAWFCSAWIVFALPVLLAWHGGWGAHGLAFVALIFGALALSILGVGGMLHALDKWIDMDYSPDSD